MALKIAGNGFVHGPTPSNQNPKVKKAEELLIKITSQIAAASYELRGMKGAEGIVSRLDDMNNGIQNLRGTLFNLSHGR